MDTIRASLNCHNLLGIELVKTFSLPACVLSFSSSCLSAINFANREPFVSLMLSSGRNFDRSGSEGPGLGDNGGTSAHTDEMCSSGLSRTSRSDRFVMSEDIKEKSSEGTE